MTTEENPRRLNHVGPGGSTRTDRGRDASIRIMKLEGLLAIDKPPGITSRDAVDRAAKWFPRKIKIGHAGTLDPLATGVLVLAIGQATRLIEYVQAMPKVYRTRISLGATSDTDDADGVVIANSTALPIDELAIRDALNKFSGQLRQLGVFAARPAKLNLHGLSFDKSGVVQPPAKPIYNVPERFRR